MPTRPAELLPLIVEFQPLFSRSVWKNVQTLLVGAFLTIGKRTVTASLRVMGQSDDPQLYDFAPARQLHQAGRPRLKRGGPSCAATAASRPQNEMGAVGQ
jgi:hypothetical protein